MTYVLIVIAVLSVNVQGAIPVFQEFSSKERCEAARDAVAVAMKGRNSSFNVACVPK